MGARGLVDGDGDDDRGKMERDRYTGDGVVSRSCGMLDDGDGPKQPMGSGVGEQKKSAARFFDEEYGDDDALCLRPRAGSR